MTITVSKVQTSFGECPTADRGERVFVLCSVSLQLCVVIWPLWHPGVVQRVTTVCEF